MPKAAPGSRASARLSSPGAEGVGEDGLLEGQTEGEAALEAVGELDGKFEEWHLQAKQDAAEAKAASASGQAAVRAEIAGLTALVAKLNQPTLRLAWVLVVHCRHQPNGALLLWHSSYGCVYN